MKVSGFHSVLTKHLIFILCTAWASNAFAYLKINYESSDLIWQSEASRLDDGDYAHLGEFFYYQTINFEVDLVIPEFEFPSIDPVLLTFDDVVVDIKTSDLFTSPVVTNSRFELELTPGNVLYPLWSLTFDVVDNQNPANGAISSGRYYAAGSLEFNADGSGVGGGWAEFAYHLDNWVYTRHDMEWILDSEVNFVADTSSLTIEKVSVPEPFSLGLLFIGLGAIVFARRKIKRENK